MLKYDAVNSAWVEVPDQGHTWQHAAQSLAIANEFFSELGPAAPGATVDILGATVALATKFRAPANSRWRLTVGTSNVSIPAPEVLTFAVQASPTVQAGPYADEATSLLTFANADGAASVKSVDFKVTADSYIIVRKSSTAFLVRDIFVSLSKLQ